MIMVSKIEFKVNCCFDTKFRMAAKSQDLALYLSFHTVKGPKYRWFNFVVITGKRNRGSAVETWIHLRVVDFLSAAIVDNPGGFTFLSDNVGVTIHGDDWYLVNSNFRKWNFFWVFDFRKRRSDGVSTLEAQSAGVLVPCTWFPRSGPISSTMHETGLPT